MAARYRTPRFGEPLRLAFVGQQTYFEACALDERSSRVRTRYVDFREGADAEAMRAQLDRFAPHAVVVFRPEIVPAGTFDGLPALTIGFLTEPIPRSSGRKAHPDLRRRRNDLRKADPASWDRIVAFDPLIVPTADEVLPVWRALPIPVADRFYAPARPVDGTPRLGFVGRSTPHRERFLAHPKHELDIVHVAFGLHGPQLDALMASIDVAINLHNEPYPSFENRVCLHLAAGHLVVSETLSPTHGLEPGIDYLEFSEPDELLSMLRTVVRHPGAYRRVRVRGRRKAEQYRASRVWPRLVADAFADVAAFGTGRRA
ncbi:MAG: hypothetical protein IRZ32_07960 [Solirubrobacteraceae bacterium]|nr:hypothetical protein [Solirubrobacteraceae bacterium]